jgi:hypothetical protein
MKKPRQDAKPILVDAWFVIAKYISAEEIRTVLFVSKEVQTIVLKCLSIEENFHRLFITFGKRKTSCLSEYVSFHTATRLLLENNFVLPYDVNIIIIQHTNPHKDDLWKRRFAVTLELLFKATSIEIDKDVLQNMLDFAAGGYEKLLETLLISCNNVNFERLFSSATTIPVIRVLQRYNQNPNVYNSRWFGVNIPPSQRAELLQCMLEDKHYAIIPHLENICSIGQEAAMLVLNDSRASLQTSRAALHKGLIQAVNERNIPIINKILHNKQIRKKYLYNGKTPMVYYAMTVIKQEQMYKNPERFSFTEIELQDHLDEFLDN